MPGPIARGYQSIAPDLLETGISNFFANLRSLDSSANGFLQGKPKRGADRFAFVSSSTAPSASAGCSMSPRRPACTTRTRIIGQTLAVWGWKKSRYVYVPLVGPSTVRDLPMLALRRDTAEAGARRRPQSRHQRARCGQRPRRLAGAHGHPGRMRRFRCLRVYPRGLYCSAASSSSSTAILPWRSSTTSSMTSTKRNDRTLGDRWSDPVGCLGRRACVDGSQSCWPLPRWA